MELETPFDTRLEEEVIGSMILDPACIAELIEIVKPEHFYHHQYRLLCEKIFELWQKDETLVTVPELVPFLQKNNISVSKIAEIASSVVLVGIEHHAKRLRDLSRLRELIKIGHELVQLGHLREREEIKEAIEQAESKIFRLVEEENKGSTVSISSALVEFVEEFEALRARGEGITGIPSGFHDLDLKTCGFQKADLIIVGGRPSMGKTAFALQLALNVSEKNPVLFFSLEMSRKALIKRMVASDSKINLRKINSGLVTEEEYLKYTDAVARLGYHQLYIDDRPNLSVAEMKASARKMKREKGLSLIIIDYLQYIRGSGRKERHLEIGEITRSLKAMAKELDIPVIVLAQLSRAVEQRNDKRPMMSDLRESGDIEQDADLIMFLYRDEYYNPDSNKRNILEVIISKQRNGPTGTVELLYLKEFNFVGNLTLETA